MQQIGYKLIISANYSKQLMQQMTNPGEQMKNLRELINSIISDTSTPLHDKLEAVQFCIDQIMRIHDREREREQQQFQPKGGKGNKSRRNNKKN
jgi:hypothetical protein